MSYRTLALLLASALTLLLACTEPAPDEALWLEDSAGERALAWVADQNDRTLSELGADPRFARYETEAAAILTDPGRIPFASPMGDHVYNTWQDREHPYGVWRR
ncbi:MAG TPA: S9 family peptidase, partial [Vicinamibacteria bacterium]|nr:S9 family peptidase [Vicinamibacteria bacterium]